MNKKGKLVTSLFLSLTLSVAALSMAGCSKDDQSLTALNKAGTEGKTIAITFTHRRVGLLNYIFGPTWVDYTQHAPSAEQLTAVKEYANDKIMPVTYTTLSYVVNEYLPTREEGYYQARAQENAFYKLSLSTDHPFLSSCIEVDPDTAEEDLSLTKDKRLIDQSVCRMPETYHEIALSSYQADIFMEFGLKDHNGTEWTIATPDDLIGKTLRQSTNNDTNSPEYLTIVGVYSSQDEGTMSELKSVSTDDKAYFSDKELLNTIDRTVARHAYVLPKFYAFNAHRSWYEDGIYEKNTTENPNLYVNYLPYNHLSTLFIPAKNDAGENKRLLEQLQYRDFQLNLFVFDYYKAKTC